MKIQELFRQKGVFKKIISDIYGYNYGGVKELGLADWTNIDDFRSKLESLKSVWDNLCPGFHKWFSKKWVPILSKVSLKVYEQVPKYRECITRIRFIRNTSRKKWSSPIKRNCGRRNFKIEETGRQKGKRRSKSNFWVRSLLLGCTIWAPWNSILWVPKNEESMFRNFDSTCQQWNKGLKSLRKVGKKQAKNKEKERRPQKSLLKESRKMRKQQELMIQMSSHIRFTFLIFSPTTCLKVAKKL